MVRLRKRRVSADDAMDYGQPAGGDYEHEPVGEAGDRLSAGQPLDHHGFTPGSIGGAISLRAQLLSRCNCPCDFFRIQSCCVVVCLLIGMGCCRCLVIGAGDSLPGAPGADLPGQEATFKTPQSAKAKKGKSPAKGTPGAEAAGSTPGKGALRQKHKSPVGPKARDHNFTPSLNAIVPVRTPFCNLIYPGSTG